MFWVNVFGKGEDFARLENLSDATLHEIVPLLAALGAGAEFGHMGSESVQGGCLRQPSVGPSPLLDALTLEVKGQITPTTMH